MWPLLWLGVLTPWQSGLVENHPERKSQSECSRGVTQQLPGLLGPRLGSRIALLPGHSFAGGNHKSVQIQEEEMETFLLRETDKIISQKSKRYYWSIFGKLNLTKKPFFPYFQHQVAFAEKSLFLLLFPPLESEYAKTLCTSLLNSILHACCSTISVVSDSATLWTADCQESLSMGFSKQECWSGLPHPVPGDLSNRGIKPGSPVSSASQADSLPLSHWGSPNSVLSSVQFSRSVVSDFLRPLELQHARPPCPSPTPGVYSNSCPSSR